MKKLNGLIACLFAPLFLVFPLSATAKMDILVADISGFPIPGDGGACLGGASVESGSLKVMSQTTIDKNGGLHVVYHEQLINVIVMDLGGNYYRAVGTTNVAPVYPGFTSLNIPSGGSFSIHASVNNRIVPIGNPDLPTYVLHVLYQMTINANGEVATEVFDVQSECFD